MYLQHKTNGETKNKMVIESSSLNLISRVNKHVNIVNINKLVKIVI